MSFLSVAALQLELCVEDNLSVLEREIDLVKRRFPWIQMVVLPELWPPTTIITSTCSARSSADTCPGSTKPGFP